MKQSLVAVFFVLFGIIYPFSFGDRTATAAEPSFMTVDNTRPEWESRYVKEARITIEKGVMSVMNGLSSPRQLHDSVESFCRTWENWAESRLFILQDERDIDVYGNLYSLQVLCRTLRLAAEDWRAAEKNAVSERTLERAIWLEEQSRLLADPVAEIISRQSYSEYLPRRVAIMKEQFHYVDEFYHLHSFRSVLP